MSSIVEKTALFVLTLFAVALTIFAQSLVLYGRWEAKESWGNIVLELKADGSGVLDGAPIRFTVQGNRLFVDEEGLRNDYTFQLTGNRLVLSGGDLDDQMVFERVGGSPASEEPARGLAARIKAKERNEKLGIVGKWQAATGSQVEIRSGGSLTIDGAPYRYSVEGSTITVTGPEGSAVVPYTLNGDQLTVTVEGQLMTLRRSGNASATGATGQPAPGGGSLAGPLGAELAGKWCYVGTVPAIGGGRVSSECFTLSPDGTFEYYSEAATSSQYGSSASQINQVGTWTATATTITANLREGGTVTYQLEKRNHPKTGDPMLCLDGRCFVTYGPRAPWR
ncbi:MAG: hypothetical protein ACE15E_23575 [Acidobacteriota bacterium]